LDDFINGKYQGPELNQNISLHQMTDGVQHIHSKNLVHRDIKPANVLIRVEHGEPVLKISDFGCCKKSRDGVFSLSSPHIGTLNYLAPELLSLIDDNNVQVSEMTNAGDIFALGCVLFKFLTRGTHPFGSGFSILSNIMSGTSDLSCSLIKFFFLDFRVNNFLNLALQGHFALDVIKRMIHTSADQRPSIAEISKALPVPPIGE
jgi:serine/threonine protein kinase